MYYKNNKIIYSRDDNITVFCNYLTVPTKKKYILHWFDVFQ